MSGALGPGASRQGRVMLTPMRTASRPTRHRSVDASKPDPHVHLAKQLGGHREMLSSALRSLDALKEPSQPEMAVRLERPHPELASQSQSRVIAAFRLRE